MAVSLSEPALLALTIHECQQLVAAIGRRCGTVKRGMPRHGKNPALDGAIKRPG